MAAKPTNQRIDDLLNSVTQDLMAGVPQHFSDNTLRVERLLLEIAPASSCLSKIAKTPLRKSPDLRVK